MIDVMRLARGTSDYGRDARGRESFDFDEHGLHRFATLILEEAAKICVTSGKVPSSMWQEPGCWQHSADCCAIAILAAKPQESKT